MDVVQKAKNFALHAHRDHVRNDRARTPYVHHLAEVAELVRASGGSQNEIAAAWLHDSVEDTSTSIEDIQREFGDDIAVIVTGVTDLPEWSSLSLQNRKLRQAERIASATDSIKRVKLADQSSNVEIVGRGYEFGIDNNLVYITGALRIAEMCRGVSSYLDELFRERYEIAFMYLNGLQEKARGHGR
jgi:(p)ppGpp synthase/HD superfamily hydrolase